MAASKPAYERQKDRTAGRARDAPNRGPPFPSSKARSMGSRTGPDALETEGTQAPIPVTSANRPVYTTESRTLGGNRNAAFPSAQILSSVNMELALLRRDLGHVFSRTGQRARRPTEASHSGDGVSTASEALPSYSQ